MDKQAYENATSELVWKIIIVLFRILMYVIGFTMMLWVIDEKLNVLSRNIFELYKIVPALGIDGLKSAYKDSFWNMFGPGIVVALTFLPNILNIIGVSFFNDMLSVGNTRYKLIEKDSGRVVKEWSSFFDDILGSVFGLIVCAFLVFAFAFYVAPFIIAWNIIKVIIAAIRLKKISKQSA